MKKLYVVLLFVAASFFAQAQLNVVFAVDMNGVSEFDPAVNVVTLGGNFQGWSPGAEVFTDADGNGVYTYTYEGTVAAGAEIMFKYVLDAWETNEFHPSTPGTPGDCTVDDGSGNINRVEMIPADATGTYMMPIYKYNTCDISTEPISGLEDQISTLTGVQITPNPARDVAMITFDNPTNATHDVIVTSLTGQTVAMYNSVRGTNLAINVADFAAGVYFVAFRNELGELGAERLVKTN